MTSSAALTEIRKRHFALEALPDTIVIPVLGDVRREQVVKLIEAATLDDIAFALLGVEAEFSAVGDRLHALRKLYGIARQAGARAGANALSMSPRATREAADGVAHHQCRRTSVRGRRQDHHGDLRPERSR